MLKRIIFILVLGLHLCPSINEAQNENVYFRLLDKSTNEPIIGAHFIYDNQMGVSDDNGKISFIMNSFSEMTLSHIQYGKWKLNSIELSNGVKEGVIFKIEEAYNLQPITVIALHKKSNEKETIGLDINDKLSHDGVSVLNQAPVINSIRKSGNYGFDPIMRGFKYDQLNVVIDGVQSAVAACPNRMDPPISQVAPNMMEHVEIFKGPHSLRYGSSFGGTINFVPSKPKFSLDQKVYGRISGSSESNGGVYRTEGTVGYSMNNIDMGFFGSYSKGGNYTDGNGNEVLAGFNRTSLGAVITAKINDGNTIKLSLTRNIADHVDFPALPMDLTSDKTTLLNLNHNFDIGGENLKTWNSSVFYSNVDHKMDNLEKVMNPRMLDAITNANTLTIGGRTEGNWLFTSSRLFAGADFKIEQADGSRTREFLMGPNTGRTVYDNVWNGGKVSKFGLFGEYHHLFSSFNIVLSGRIEYNKAEATDLNDGFAIKNSDIEKSQINPSISIGFLRNISPDLTIGLWFGRAQRSGSITERYINSFPVGIDPYDMLGNPGLKPEVNNQMDLTLAYNTMITKIDISAFGSILKDYISSEIDLDLTPTMPSSPGVRRFMNIDDAMMVGFEITWIQKLFSNVMQNVSVAYTYGKDKIRDEPLPEIAPMDFRYGIAASYLENKLNPEISFRYVLKQGRVSNSFGENLTPSFTLMNFKVNYRLSEIIGFTLGVQNIFDEAYYEHLSRNVRGTDKAIYAPGRNIYLSLYLDLM